MTLSHHGIGITKNVNPGDTVEVHWVCSSCDTQSGKGLAACVPKNCKNPKIRVESQVFLVLDDKDALDFSDYIESEAKKWLLASKETNR